MTAQDQLPDLSMDSNALYREDTYTDRRIGTLRQLTPVDAEGAIDGSRAVRYSGQTQLMTPAGALQLVFEIEADSMQQAIERFPVAAKQSLEQTMEELKEMQRQQASSIVVPGQGGGMGGSSGGFRMP